MKMKFPKLLKSATALAFLSTLAASAGLALAHAEDKINIIMDGGPLWDPFFGAMKKGGEDAAKDLGADLSGSRAPTQPISTRTTLNLSNNRRAVTRRR